MAQGKRTTDVSGSTVGPNTTPNQNTTQRISEGNSRGNGNPVTQAAGNVAETAKNVVNQTTETARDLTNVKLPSIGDLTEQATNKGGTLLHQTQHVAGQALDTAKNQVVTQLSAQKDRAAESLDTTITVLDNTVQQFRDQNLGLIADYADSLSTQARRLSDYLRDKDISEVTHDLELFARRNPAMFLGGAFITGVALSRFLKSSAPAPQAGPQSYNNDRLLPARLSDTRMYDETTRLNDRTPGVSPTGYLANDSTMGTPQSSAVDTRQETAGTTTGRGRVGSLDAMAGPDPNDFGNRPLTAHNYVPGREAMQSNVE